MSKMRSPKMLKRLTILHEIRCPNCNRLLGILNGTFEIKCNKCKQIIVGHAG